MIYLTQFDQQTRQPTGPSQPLPCDSLEAAETFMGPPSSRYRAMLIYQGSPAFAVSKARICIDGPSNSGQTTDESNHEGSTQQ